MQQLLFSSDANLAKDRKTCSALEKRINSRLPVTAGRQVALLTQQSGAFLKILKYELMFLH